MYRIGKQDFEVDRTKYYISLDKKGNVDSMPIRLR